MEKGYNPRWPNAAKVKMRLIAFVWKKKEGKNNGQILEGNGWEQRTVYWGQFDRG